MKPPQYGAATPWHQDEAYFNPAQIHNNLSVWIPLQEATVENGCMQFIPGSHKEVLPHHHIGHDPDVPGLEIDQIEPENAVACPIPAGGATIHNCRTLHYAGPNLSDIPRRAYVLIFGTPTLERDIPRDFPWRNKK
jgi:ectoine hydroxylase-related dioxygenase (phytanoyl-CoA dioxygenase family)